MTSNCKIYRLKKRLLAQVYFGSCQAPTMERFNNGVLNYFLKKTLSQMFDRFLNMQKQPLEVFHKIVF